MNNMCFSLFRRQGSLRPWCRRIRCLPRARFLVRDGPLFPVSSRGDEGAKGALWSLLYENANPIHEGSTLVT